MIEKPENQLPGSGSPTTQALIAFLEEQATEYRFWAHAEQLRAAADALRSLQQPSVELQGWRTWAQFVYLKGGPVTKTDAELQKAVCEAHDAEHVDIIRELWVAEAEVARLAAELVEAGMKFDSLLFHHRATERSRDAARAEVARLTPQKDGAYRERDALVAAVSKFLPSHLARHPDSDTTWDRDWRWIVCVHGPSGQMTWHIHDSELKQFDHLVLDAPRCDGWDGHSTEEKYKRLAALEPTASAVARLTQARDTRLCQRCKHPDHWHRHDDADNASPTDPACKFRCLGYDCDAPGYPAGTPETRCGCPDFVWAEAEPLLTPWFAVYCEGEPCAAYPRKRQAEVYASAFAKPTEVRELLAAEGALGPLPPTEVEQKDE